jgi:glycosyltransferase involved in cell wall biosynthesis
VKNQAKLVSVLIAVYNESRYIEECVDSLFGQKYKNIEIIIVDDLSTDSTYELAKNLETLHARVIKVYKNTTKGKASAFNLAYKKSSGDVITLLGGDDMVTDVYITSRIEKLESLLVDSTKASVFGRLKSFSEDERYNNIITPKKPGSNNYSGGLMMLSKPLAELIFPVPSGLPSEDGWVGLHSKYFSEKSYVEDIVLNYRIHEGNTINRHSSFSETSDRIAGRRNSEILFLEKYNNKLLSNQIKDLQSNIDIEYFRFHGNICKILLIKGVSTRDKLRALSCSSQYIYALRMAFFNIFSGW